MEVAATSCGCCYVDRCKSWGLKQKYGPTGYYCEIIVNIFKTACCWNRFLPWLFHQYTQSSFFFLLWNWGLLDMIWETTFKLIKNIPPSPTCVWLTFSPLYLLCFFFVVTPNIPVTPRTAVVHPALESKERSEKKLECKFEDMKVQITRLEGGRASIRCVEDRRGREAMMLLKDYSSGPPDGKERRGMETCLCMQLTLNDSEFLTWNWRHCFLFCVHDLWQVDQDHQDRAQHEGKWTLCVTSLMLKWKIEGHR